MKKLLLTIILIGNSILMLAQNESKPALDTSVFNKWPSVGVPVISNDGKYASYNIYNQPVGSTTLVIKTVMDSWKMELPGLNNASFTVDSRLAIFIKPQDSLCLLTLGSSSAEYISRVISFRLFMQGDNEWLVYQLNTPTRELVFRNLSTGFQKLFSGVMSYLLSNSGNKLVLQTKTNNDEIVVQLMSFPNGKGSEIWKGSNASGFVFDDIDSQLAFVVDSGVAVGNQKGKSLWCYKEGTGKPVMLASSQSAGIDSGLTIGNISNGFSKDGKRLFITLNEMGFPQPEPNAVMVDIWSYTDSKLQSQQLKELAPKNYMAVLHIDDYRIIRLQQENETINWLGIYNTDSIVVVSLINGDARGQKGKAPLRPNEYVVSAIDGTRRRIDIKRAKYFLDKRLSPAGKYIIGTTLEQGDYLIYNLVIGRPRNLTQSLPIPLIDTEYDQPDRKYRALSFATWSEDERSVLLYDKYDIWQIDLAGNRLPVNLTNGYGRKHNIVLRLARDYNGKSISNSEKLILTAFNRANKKSGFFIKTLNKKGDPELLTMGPNVYTLHSVIKRQGKGEGNLYLISRSSSTKSDNYFCTKDFKTFTAITDVFPEKNYNWLTTELLTWKMLDGRKAQGILYKPENFDSKRKYPIIFYYYEKMSNELHRYQRPEASPGWINIPWFVSNGYLIFSPDIHYTIGEPGNSAYNSVVSAAKYLSKFPWVDASRMGITGHSFGGYETNFIVTNTNLFACAMSSSGFSDLVSSYNSLAPSSGQSLQYFCEIGQNRIGATLWDKPQLFLKNSPIFIADKVTIPLLMMNNKDDGIVPFAQGIEFFTALRRLGKRVWMLQYDGEVHSLLSEKASMDYTIRITQFFDHYLKGAPAPKWMTQGINARFKGIDSGLELDYSIKTPGPGLLVEFKEKK